MAYKEDIPQSTDVISNSQADLLGNFQIIKQLIDKNHATFGSPQQGKHNVVMMPVQTPVPVLDAGDAALYTLSSPLGIGVSPELFLRRPSGPGADVPLTPRFANANGWSYLPSGILLKWGNGTGSGNFTLNFDVQAEVPVFTGVVNALVSTFDTSTGQVDTAVRLSEITNTFIRVYCSARTSTGAVSVNFRYLVIGI